MSALSNKTATRYAELQVTTNFSFLRGASHGEELVAQAHALGIAAIAVTDRNTLAGVVRAHVAAKEVGLKLIVGARLDLQDAPSLLCLPRDRQAYGRLSRLLSEGQMRAKKGECTLYLEDVARHAEGQIFIALAADDWDWRALSSERVAREAPPTADIIPFRLKGSPLSSPSPLMGEGWGRGGVQTSIVLDTPLPDPPPQGGREKRKQAAAAQNFEAELRRMKAVLGDSPLYLAASHTYRGDDRARIAALAVLAKRCSTPLVATGDVLYHAPQRRPLQDVLTCVREKTTIGEAGFKLAANAERHLKAPREMARLFRGHEDAILRTLEIAEACRFSLDDLKYEYPDEPIPPGKTPQGHLEDLTWEGARWRFPDGIPDKVRGLIERELALIDQLGYAQYFLTVHDIVHFARSRGILCQGRGSAANSAVCYCLAVTAVNPTEIDVLFERFISPERREPPDIDVDFEHERREEVIQYIYARYGRDRAGLAATVISYRARSAVRDVGKAMGLSEDTVSALSGMVWGTSSGGTLPEKHVRAAGLDPKDKLLATVLELAHELMGFPRHLSQHVGGFVLTRGPLIEVVPVGNAAMEDRTFIEWDKDDIAALGLLKVDVLALGMLTCIRKAFDLIVQHEGKALTLATVPREDSVVYDMLCKADSVGVFQVESRAQMNMLPRLKPRCFYDLVIEVAIVRPGPIQGDMVHPYLRRRDGVEVEHYPSPSPEHGPKDELRNILGKTKGVPLFQEQAMRIALVAAKFSDAEVNELRKAMATFRRRGTIGLLEEKMVSRMTARGYDKDFAQRCFNQIKGFGEYGFPESHAASFAHLVYVSSWIKCHHPAAFAAALLNAQPMGFYAPAQIVRDAREHGVEVRAADVNLSDWDTTLESPSPRVRGEGRGEGQKLAQRRGAAPHPDPLPMQEGMGRGNGGPAMRLGLRQIDGLQEEEIKKLVAARASSPGARAETCVDGRLRGHDVVESHTDDALQTMSSRGSFPAASWIPGTSPGMTMKVAEACLEQAADPHPGPLVAAGRGEDSGKHADLASPQWGEAGATCAACASGEGEHPERSSVSSRHLLPGSIVRPGAEPADAWIPGTSPGMTVAAAMKPFRDVHDVWARARVKLITLEKLAAADAFRSVGRDRRQALWEVKALSAAEPLPLFTWSETREAAAEPFVQLPQMRLSEHVVNDYQTLRLSLKAHPMSFLRLHLNELLLGSNCSPPLSVIPAQAGTRVTSPQGHALNFPFNDPKRNGDLDPRLRGDDGRRSGKGGRHGRRILACDELRGIRDGAWVTVAGVVLVRQRPGSAKGVVFMTIEDETGIANAVIWAKQLERFRKEVMASRLIVIHGRVQRHEDIIHVVASRLEDRSDWLQLLSADAVDMKVPVANADEVLRPDPRSPPEGKFPADANANKMHPRWATHPRYVRVLPKSRDFH